MIRGGARILVRGDIKQNFIHEIPLKSCTAMASPKFRFGGHSAKMYSPKTFEKFIKHLHKNFKKFSKIFQK